MSHESQPGFAHQISGGQADQSQGDDVLPFDHGGSKGESGKRKAEGVNQHRGRRKISTGGFGADENL
jgi:hypothetical protein